MPSDWRFRRQQKKTSYGGDFIKAVTMGVFLRHLNRETRRYLDFVKLFPERNIPVFCEETESPSKAEQEARDKIAFLRGMALDGIPSESVFLVCHVDSLQIWCEFSLNALPAMDKKRYV